MAQSCGQLCIRCQGFFIFRRLIGAIRNASYSFFLLRFDSILIKSTKSGMRTQRQPDTAAGGRVRFVTSVTGENRTNHIRHRPIIRFPLSDSVVSQANTRVSIRYPFESPALYREMHSPARCVHAMSPAERFVWSNSTQKLDHLISYRVMQQIINSLKCKRDIFNLRNLPI